MRQIDVVGAVIVNDRGEILCALRSVGMSMAGFWEFPGGKIEPGEEPQAALQREIAEELGCTIAVGDLVAEATHEYPGKLVRLRTYYANVTAGVPTAIEHERLIWVPPAHLAALNWAPADKPTVSRLANR